MAGENSDNIGAEVDPRSWRGCTNTHIFVLVVLEARIEDRAQNLNTRIIEQFAWMELPTQTQRLQLGVCKMCVLCWFMHTSMLLSKLRLDNGMLSSTQAVQDHKRRRVFQYTNPCYF